ncbi:peptide chain release factor 2 [Egicoccus halophilus]|uniref:Peptide chain release factor 2 n=1 Tax=Egicoccus halophilus TaxID=1670830 RepID=A0A8J3AI93_9ACTN|nr:peptide chain release factor 2 [Egicoccus halophilus]GGI09519.1 peptide chain release factor 2 [Egicoccus halophilus]
MPDTHADDIAASRGRVAQLESDLDIAGKRQRLEELQELAGSPGLWDDPDRARGVTTELSRVEGDVQRYDALVARLDDLEVLDELAAEEGDEGSADEVVAGLQAVAAELDRFEIATMLGGEHDHDDAIVSIHAGEGGVDAMDWAQMLQRMYLRWAETRGFDTEVFDQSYGEEAGLKSTTFEVRGADAYGWLNAEHGVHRLVRISPFDSQARRQTSFALVDVVPVLPEVDEEVAVPDEDIRVDVYRSSGPGGQSVNTTDSAVRITHLPTGLVASCQNEKSQHQNKAAALRVLKAKLAELERLKRAEQLDELRGAVQNVGFGSQIRSYVLHPYQMVKDLRSEHETGNVQSVLDGDLDGLIEAELRRRVREAQEA